MKRIRSTKVVSAQAQVELSMTVNEFKRIFDIPAEAFIDGFDFSQANNPQPIKILYHYTTRRESRPYLGKTTLPITRRKRSERKVEVKRRSH